MPFSLNPKSTREINLIEITPKAFLGLAVFVAKQIGWEVDSIEENKIVLGTPFFFPTGGELFTISIENESKAKIESKNISWFIPFELGKNAANIQQFLEQYAEVYKISEVALYEQRFEEVLNLWNKNSNN